MTLQPIRLQQLIRFGEDFALDLRPRRLRRGSHVLKLERIPLEILILLLEHPGEIVSRDEIVTRVWGNDVFLDTDNSIRGAIRKIRQVLKDDPETPRFIQTVTGRGYRFIAPVISFEAGWNAAARTCWTKKSDIERGIYGTPKPLVDWVVGLRRRGDTLRCPRWQLCAWRRWLDSGAGDEFRRPPVPSGTRSYWPFCRSTT